MDFQKVTEEGLKKLIEERDIIIIMNFGSTLYGLETPQSDRDFKGIFVPTAREILLGTTPKSINITPKKDGQGIKNGADDVDIELYSLQYFIELCLKGETVGVDMLHANAENIIYQSGKTWEYIQSERSSFYSTNLHALCDYIARQAHKYGTKGSRINSVKEVITVLKISGKLKLKDVWDQLPDIEHTHKITDEKGVRMYEVCGKKYQETATVEYVLERLIDFEQKYGQRARDAAENKNIDFKSVSHAIRYAEQLEELFSTGDIKFPLKDAEFIKQVKLGKLDFKLVVEPYLDVVIERVEELASASKFPEMADRKTWEKFIEEYYEYVILKNTEHGENYGI